MNLKKYIWLAALPMIFTACQEDMLVENLQQGITTLTASMDKAPSDSRAQIVLDGSNTAKEIFHWNAGDKFTLFQLGDESNAWTEHVFSISSTYSDNEPTAQADFSTSSALTPGCDFVAFYPACTPDAKGGIQLSIDNELPTNNAASWKSYFMNNMFMKTRVGAVGSTSADTEVNFEQLCGIIRIKYTNASKTDRTFDRIGVNGRWTTGRYYMVSDAETFDERDSSIGWLGVEFENKATVRAGETQNFYILYFSNGVDGEVKPMSQVIVDLDVANKTTLVTPAKELPQFKAGECYWLNITDTGAKLLWTNDQQGGADKPNEDDESVVCDASTFDDLKKALASPQQDDKFTDIQIRADITLTEPLIVNKPVNLIMNGKTLTLGYTLQAGEGAIINNSDLYIRTEGVIEAPSKGTEVDAYLFKSGSGMLYFGNVIVNAGIVKNVAYIKDGKGRVYLNAVLNASGYTLDIESDSYSDVDIYTGTLNGDVRWKLNSAEYTKLCRFGAGPNSTINGDLVWAGQYGGTANGYKIEFGSPVTINGENWVTTGGTEGGGNQPSDKPYFEVSDFEGLKKAIEQVTDEKSRILFKENIVMTEPLTINKRMTWTMDNRILSVDERFNWDTSAEAAITVTDGSLNIDCGTIFGSTAIVKGKYLIKFSGEDFGIHQGSELSPKGIEHALLVVDARAHIDNSVIQVSQGGYAVNVLAENKFAQLDFHQGANVNGIIGFTANYKATEPDLNRISVQDGSTITGALNLAGRYKSEVDVNTHGGNVNGAGWSDILFARLQEDFKNHGGAGEEILSLNGQTLTFTVGTTHEGQVNFGARRLEGAGTIKFVNNGEDPVTLYLDIEEFLSASVEFEFEGEFRKIIQAKTDRLKEFFEMAKGSDEIFLTLPNDMILGEQIVIDSSMQWSDGSENSAPQGHLCLRLAGHTLTYESNVPAIVLQGGFFILEGADKDESATGTIKTTTEFFQVGAAADASNNNITLIVEPVTFDTEHKTWVYVNGTESATAHKDVEIFLHSETLTTPEEKQAKVRVEESYKGSVDIKG